MEDIQEIIIAYDRKKVGLQLIIMALIVVSFLGLLLMDALLSHRGLLENLLLLILLPVFVHRIYILVKLLISPERAILIGKTGLEDYYSKTGFIPYDEIRAACLCRSYNGKTSIALNLRDEAFGLLGIKRLNWLSRSEYSLEGSSKNDFSIDVVLNTSLTTIAPEKLIEIVSSRLRES